VRTEPKRARLLQDMLVILNKASTHLEKSFLRCKKFISKSQQSQENLFQSEENLEFLEAFTSRFARLTDILFKRAYRTLLYAEFEDVQNYLDMLHKIEKRKLIDSIHVMAELKDLRNHIAHEYASENMAKIIQDILNYTPVLLNLVKILQEYAKPLLEKE
jgi:hypothetical protein